MTADEMVRAVLEATHDWDYEVVSIGYPGPVVDGKPLREPYNLGKGWIDLDYQGRFGRPVKLLNDAAMQALGSYQGGRMLFLGLGTGLGSALVIGKTVVPLELAHLPYRKGRTFEDYVGLRGLERLGKKKWRRAVADVVGAAEGGDGGRLRRARRRQRKTDSLVFRPIPGLATIAMRSSAASAYGKRTSPLPRPRTRPSTHRRLCKQRKKQRMARSDDGGIASRAGFHSAPIWAPFSATERFINSTRRTSATPRAAHSQKTSK